MGIYIVHYLFSFAKRAGRCIEQQQQQQHKANWKQNYYYFPPFLSYTLYIVCVCCDCSPPLINIHTLKSPIHTAAFLYAQHIFCSPYCCFITAVQFPLLLQNKIMRKVAFFPLLYRKKIFQLFLRVEPVAFAIVKLSFMLFFSNFLLLKKNLNHFQKRKKNILKRFSLISFPISFFLYIAFFGIFFGDLVRFQMEK